MQQYCYLRIAEIHSCGSHAGCLRAPVTHHSTQLLQGTSKTLYHNIMMYYPSKGLHGLYHIHKDNSIPHYRGHYYSPQRFDTTSHLIAVVIPWSTYSSRQLRTLHRNKTQAARLACTALHGFGSR
ncbi:hypothetical protein E2C01_067845 [Portunus trituberculatus]|uniref:Uncharacterized protein n=1 Tax=Portunus trituberculatus TaxID=210409 RepID=A0A5B7HU50_PORTR|nr:hypothetical protein [Portunus trituberculatus]